MKARVTLKGQDRVRRAFRALSERTQPIAEREVRRAALEIQSTAKQLAPVDTGRLRNSIATEYADGGLTARIGTNVEYAPYVEFGTRRGQRAQPYLFPAFEQEWPRFLARLKRELGA